MKREMVFAFSILVSLALAGVVSAGCANDDQTIMRLAAATNAHGALWNQDYGVKVCYDDYFTEAYVPASGEDAHGCGEILLKLNADSNAHAASADSSSSYSVNVCHKGLKNCEVRAGAPCPSGKIAIAYLNNLTNSHISKRRAFDDYSQGYYAICCQGQSEIIPPIIPMACADYTGRTECDTAPLSIAMADPGCKAGESCRCSWNGTTENSGKCMVSWQISRGACKYSCSIEATDQTECSGGSKIVALTASLVPVSGTGCLATTDPECRSGSLTALCGGAEAQLPFFGAWQVVTSLMAIALIYTIVCRNKRCIRHS